VEAWYPNTVWNPHGKGIYMLSDHEKYEGRKKYASIGGCYYASRLAVSDTLEKERRQATAIILREAHPGYIMPLGVWHVRENVRNALNNPYLSFDSLDASIEHVRQRFRIPLERWFQHSSLLRDAVYQKRLEDYV
jgi:hypothetical protein